MAKIKYVLSVALLLALMATSPSMASYSQLHIEQGNSGLYETRYQNNNAVAVFSYGVHVHTDDRMREFDSDVYALVETYGGKKPMASAEATQTMVNRRYYGGSGPGIGGSAHLTYGVTVKPKFSPLVYNPPIRLFADAVVDVNAPSLTGRAEALAKVELRPNFDTGSQQAYFLYKRATNPRSSGSESRRWSLTVPATGGSVAVNLTARANVSGYTWNGVGSTSESSANAVADPVFSFDQEGFDLAMAEAGLESFLLEDFYEITYSQGVMPAVPVPGTASLLSLGLLCLAGVSRKKNR